MRHILINMLVCYSVFKILLCLFPRFRALAPFGEHSLVFFFDITRLGGLLDDGLIVAQCDELYASLLEACSATGKP